MSRKRCWRASSFAAFVACETADDPRYIRIDLSWAHSIATQSLGAHHACLVAALKSGFPLAVEGAEGSAARIGDNRTV